MRLALEFPEVLIKIEKSEKHKNSPDISMERDVQVPALLFHYTCCARLLGFLPLSFPRLPLMLFFGDAGNNEGRGRGRRDSIRARYNAFISILRRENLRRLAAAPGNDVSPRSIRRTRRRGPHPGATFRRVSRPLGRLTQYFPREIAAGLVGRLKCKTRLPRDKALNSFLLNGTILASGSGGEPGVDSLIFVGVIGQISPR